MSYKLFRKPTKDETTVIFVDPAEGGDYSAMAAISKKFLDIFMSYHSKTAETKSDIGTGRNSPITGKTHQRSSFLVCCPSKLFFFLLFL